MSLKKKLILLLFISGSILAFSFLISFNIFMFPSLKKNKVIFIENLKKKFKTALSIEEQNLAVLCDEWSTRRCMSDYIENPSPALIKDTFPDKLFVADRLDLILVLDMDKQVLFIKGFYQDNKSIDYEHLNIGSEINKITRIISRVHQKVISIIKSPYGPLMSVADPIWAKKETKQPAGILLLGQFIDQEMGKRLSKYTTENIEILPYNDQQLNSFYQDQMQAEDFVSWDKRDKLCTFYLVNDINAQPAVILHNKSDNKLFKVVNQHTIYFIGITIFITIFLGIMLYHYIDKSTIRRMRLISRTMKKIGGLEDLSIRVERDNQEDEISHLIANLNFTLDKLENEKVNREEAEKTMLTHSKLVSIGRLSSNIAHEINNPVLAISNTIQVIKKGIKKKTRLISEAIDISESEINRIRNIISGLLDFHRLDQEEFSNLNIKDIVQQCLDLLKWSNKLGSTKITQKLEGDWFVYGSPVKLKQVFINFILNAVEAMEGMNGTLRIEACTPRKDKNLIEIHFIDNGPGIPDEIKGYLFEPFISTKVNRGVGLGLYISYEIISYHHGEIIYNEKHKPGTHFIIKLPINKRCTDE